MKKVFVAFVSGLITFCLLGASVTYFDQIVAKTTIVGVTDASSAAAGNVGEQLTQSRLKSAAASATTATTLNVTASALSLTAGDWDVVAVVGFAPAATTTVTRLDAGISTTSATLPGTDTLAVPDATGQTRAVWNQASAAPASDITLQVVRARVNISATTSYYLVAQSTFGTSTLTVYGSITARRVR